MSSNKKNHSGEKDNKKGGFIDNTDKNHLTPDDQTPQTPESSYHSSKSGGTTIQDERAVSRSGNNNREGVNASYGDGGDRPRSNPSDNQVDRGK
ncbi:MULTISPECIES: hypothetical protein [Rufibacter]|uniref:Uncharacterized protein n=1 Tax=Rufibacter hautae TaxID=2595005 RepID=A0A5B6TN40_9BACT|nr:MULTISPECIES: hypothetical protein [Rufibacter]KAA3440787.1 hypothetical protein FOA19_09120 [Rufibacter hautae]